MKGSNMKETNMEHYRNEILEALEYANMGFGKVDGEIKNCTVVGCERCDFIKPNDNTCSKERLLWLMAEYKPEITLTAREKHFVECMQTGWLARDIDNDLCYYQSKPHKCNDDYWDDKELFMDMTVEVFDGMFNFIKWEDEEPWSVADLRKLKALEYNPDDVAFKGGAK